MAWEIEFTDEFAGWWDELTVKEQEAVAAKVLVLSARGPALSRPQVETLSKMSKYPNMKELRVQHGGDAYRILFAFDPRQVAILLWGGRKADEKWYKRAVPAADALYAQHLGSLRKEGLI